MRVEYEGALRELSASDAREHTLIEQVRCEQVHAHDLEAHISQMDTQLAQVAHLEREREGTLTRVRDEVAHMARRVAQAEDALQAAAREVTAERQQAHTIVERVQRFSHYSLLRPSFTLILDVLVRYLIIDVFSDSLIIYRCFGDSLIINFWWFSHYRLFVQFSHNKLLGKYVL